MIRRVLLFLAVPLALLAAVVGVLWAFQERVVWQPPTGRPADPAGVRRVDYVAEDGQPLFAYLVGEAAPGRPLVLAFHGNAELAAWNVDWARAVARRSGHAVLLAEYRGYAGLPGRTTYVGSAYDARAAWQVATDTLGIAPGDLVVHGFSLGTAVATELTDALHAAGTPPRALVLVAPFTSARDMARLGPGALSDALWRSIARVHFDTRARVARLGIPVHVAHGTRDLVIPFRMGEAVHTAAQVPGGFLRVPGAGHNDVPVTGGEDYWRWLAAALGTATSRDGDATGRNAAGG